MASAKRTTGLVALIIGVLALAAAAIVFVIALPDSWFAWDNMADPDRQQMVHWLTFTAVPGLALLLLGFPLLNCSNDGGTA